MKKRILTAIIAATTMLGLVGCASTEQAATDSVFVEIENTMYWKIVYHRETKVMYAISDSGHNHGTFTLLVDADGKPMLYGE